MRDRHAPAFSTPILAPGRAPLDRDLWHLLWRNVFQWLPWPLFALKHFSELDYYSDYL